MVNINMQFKWSVIALDLSEWSKNNQQKEKIKKKKTNSND